MVTYVSNLDSTGPEEGGPLYNSEGARVFKKLGISDGEALGIILRGSDRSKLGVY